VKSMDLNLYHQMDYVFQSANPESGFAADQKNRLDSIRTWHCKPLSDVRPEYKQFCRGSSLRARSGIDRHYHTGPVADYCRQGSWKYQESERILGTETMVSFSR
jgi:hypothetical protein